jgi:hypothetical protein
MYLSFFYKALFNFLRADLYRRFAVDSLHGNAIETFTNDHLRNSL